MVRTSVLNDALKSMNNAEKAGKRQVLIRPSSKVIVKFLSVMQRHGELASFPRSGLITVRALLFPRRVLFKCPVKRCSCLHVGGPVKSDVQQWRY